ncbi:jerky protein homolog-like [Topomyia yanbarensis]|uniref:jerky protein homolog-like n=1 Tax=Topomyia yanbarensis TaxID=2498891 RepID=UPI00273B372D|nr:jerky protein homolog-like [Topomyia yanbarensis]
MASTEKTKRKCLTLQQKVEIINLLKQQKCTKSDLARQYCVDRTTIRKIELQQKSILKLVSEGCSNNFHRRKYVTSGKYNDLEQALHDWLLEQRDQEEIVSTGTMLSKAHELAAALGIGNEFKGSENWIHNFRKRHGWSQSTDEKRSNLLSVEVVCVENNTAAYCDDDTYGTTIKQEVKTGSEYSESMERCQLMAQYLTDIIEWAEDICIEPDYIANLRTVRTIALEKC